MKRSRKVLKGWFRKRLQQERTKYEIIIKNGDHENTILRESLEKAGKVNITLQVENALLKERIDALKTKKWYQFVAAEPLILRR